MEYQRVRVTDLPGIRHDGLVVPGLTQQDASAERFTSTHCSAGVSPSSEGTSSTPVVPGCAPNVEMPSSAPRFSLSTPSRENVDLQCLSLPSTNCSDRNNDFLLPSTPDFALPFTQNRCGKSAARERNRVRMLQSAFLSLQRTLPAVPRDTKLSRLDVLLLASAYIRELVHALKSPGCPDPDLDCAALHPLKKWPMRSRLYAAITATVHPHPPSSRDGFCPATLPQNPPKGHLAGVRGHQPKVKGHEARVRVHTVKIMDSRSSL